MCLVPDWVAVLAKKTLTLVRWANSLHGSIFPHLSVSEDSLLSDDLYKLLNKNLYLHFLVFKQLIHVEVKESKVRGQPIAVMFEVTCIYSTWEVFAHMETSPLPVKVFTILGHPVDVVLWVGVRRRTSSNVLWVQAPGSRKILALNLKFNYL